MICTHCKTEVPDGAKYCPRCQNLLVAQVPQADPTRHENSVPSWRRSWVWLLLVSIVALVGMIIAVRRTIGKSTDMTPTLIHATTVDFEMEENQPENVLAATEGGREPDLTSVPYVSEKIQDTVNDDPDLETIDLSGLSRSDRRMLARAIMVAVVADLSRTEKGSSMLAVMGIASGLNPQIISQAFSDIDWREGICSADATEQRLAIMAAISDSESRGYRNLQGVLLEIDMELSEKRRSALTTNGMLKRLWLQMKRDLDGLLEELWNDDGEDLDYQIERSIPKFAASLQRECHLT